MSVGSSVIGLRCTSFREYFSFTNMKSVVHGFVYEYETPKIVTIHSISIALTCRLIQLLILLYGIGYLMIHNKGYQEINTSIISSITLKVKGIGYNQTGENQTLVIDGADYIVPPQENNALFLMTNFIRTDQEHSRCPEAPDDNRTACVDHSHCRAAIDFHKANGRWTGRCIKENNTLGNSAQSIIGLCELEGWCPVENDRDIPQPIRDALNFTIFVKNFIEFPRFKVIRKNIESSPSYLKSCTYDPVKHNICPIFRVATLLEMVESDETERTLMLRYGGVIRVKIDWKCNLDKPLSQCLPVYSFGRLDAQFKDESFSQGFNFRFASHWKHGNRSFRTLTKAYGLRFIFRGHAGRFDLITLSLNIGSLIGILGLATFLCDIVALYVHGQSDVYRQQKFQDVDLNLLRLETLNSLAEGMMSEVAKRKNQNCHERSELSDDVTGNHTVTSMNDSPLKTKFQRHKENHHQRLYDNVPATMLRKQTSSSISPSNNYHQRDMTTKNPSNEISSLSSSPLSIKQRRSNTARPTQSSASSNITSDRKDLNDRVNIVFVDEDPSLAVLEKNQSDELKRNVNTKMNPIIANGNDQLTRPTPKIETFL